MEVWVWEKLIVYASFNLLFVSEEVTWTNQKSEKEGTEKLYVSNMDTENGELGSFVQPVPALKNLTDQ